MVSVPKLLADRYQIVRRVGSGGMADVYLARDTQLGRQVAMKVLHSQYSRNHAFVERFRREARAAANLQHPNIVSIYNWGRESGYHFIVMEFVDGRSLKDVIAAEAPLDPRNGCSIAAKVLNALEFSHRSGLVHRDVKPGNILLTSSGDVRVTDFGIARASSGDTMTQTGTILGTAYYLSPEQAQGLAVDGRSDLYSLGIVLYEMMCGRRPFESDSPVAIAYKHVREAPTPPSKFRNGIPSSLETIILKAIAKRPEDRYQSAAEMRQDILAFLEGRQVTAVLPRPVETDDETQIISVSGPMRRATVRRPGWLLALTIALLVGGLAVGTWSLVNLLRPVVGGATVPAIEGRTPRDAERKLRAAGLQPSFQGQEFSEDVLEGRVTRQRPDAKRRVAGGAEVKYWVSLGLPFVQVPDLKTRLLGEAQRTLQSFGLAVGTRVDVFDPAPPNTVLDQNPRAGERVRKNTRIDVSVSKGPETAAVPDVVGRTEANATAILANQGFRVARIEGFSDFPEGEVFDQDPKGGSPAETGSTVTIYVSRGSETFAMPDVRGEEEFAAREKLEGRGLVVRTQRVSVGNQSQRGRVVDQEPPAGSTVRRGGAVTLSIGS